MVSCGRCGDVLVLHGRPTQNVVSVTDSMEWKGFTRRWLTCGCGHQTVLASGGLIPEPANALRKLEKTKEEPDETIAGLLVGVREFRVNEHGYLYSLVHDDVWSPDKPQQATCAKPHLPPGLYGVYLNGVYSSWDSYRPETHDAPDFDCECGFYSFASLDEADKAGDGFQFPQRIRAVVAAWGDVVLCEHGFRSEWMQIEAIIQQSTFAWGVYFDASRCWEKVADRYGVPVVDATDVEEFSASLGVVVNAQEERDRAAKRAADERWCAQDNLAQRLAKIIDEAKENGSKPAFWRYLMDKKGKIYGE